jgi:hypothetical protein
VTLVLFAGVLVGQSPTTAAGAAPAASAQPLLWSGRLLSRAGKATSGRVAAFVRPPARMIPMIPTTGVLPDAADLAPIPLQDISTASDGTSAIS